MTAYTNALLVRLLLGDTGLPARDVTDGDGVSREFYVSTPPALAGSVAVYLAGTLTTDYTFDYFTGRLVFTNPPPDATGNIVVLYYACQFVNEDVAEACRQEGLDPALVANAGESASAYKAAAMLARAMAGQLAVTDANAAARWAALADSLLVRAAATGAMTAGPTKRLDGYSATLQPNATDVLSVAANPRRRFYGQEDRIP